MGIPRWMPRWTARISAATAVFGLAAGVLFVLALIEAIRLQNVLGMPGSGLFSADLRWRLWSEWARPHLPLLVVSVLAASATHLVGRGRRGSTMLGGLELTGAVVWFVGAVAAAWVSGFDGGWFNYAPNAGVVFSAGEPGLDRERIGLLLACVGLVVTAGALVWSHSRRGSGGVDPDT